MSISQPRIGTNMNHPPVNFQCTLRNKNDERSVKRPTNLMSSSLEKNFFIAFWNFLVERIAGIKRIAIRTASAIRRNDGVMNIG